MLRAGLGGPIGAPLSSGVAGVRPRIGMVGCGNGPALRAALAALAGDLAEGPLDVVLLAARAGLPAGAPAPAQVVHEPRGLRDALARAREAGRGTAFLELRPGEDPLAAGRRVLGEGWLDGLLLPGEPGGAGPRLREREGARVIEPYPGTTLRGLLQALDAEAVARAGRAAAALLRRRGLVRPRLLLLDLAGEVVPAEAARRLRSEPGLELSGPLDPGAAGRERADAFLALDPAHGELLLELLGRGPETRFPLSGEAAWSEAWPARPDEAALVLAAARLGEVARAGGALAAAREAERAPVVSVKPARKPPEQPAPADRCPYCHRALDDPPGDETGDPPGAPALCTSCRTPHHRDCLAEHGRCTLLGCGGTTAERLGVTIPIARLGVGSPRSEPFRALTGDAGAGPGWLRVEAPHDDLDATPRARRLALELPRRELRPGEVLHGYVTVHAPRPLRVRGGLLRIRVELTTHEPPDPERVQPIVHREATLVGDAPAGALGRLQDGVFSLFSGPSGVAIPQGVRRWPFALRLNLDHPPTVQNRRGRVEETVSTVLEAVLDTDLAQVPLVVRR